LVEVFDNLTLPNLIDLTIYCFSRNFSDPELWPHASFISLLAWSDCRLAGLIISDLEVQWQQWQQCIAHQAVSSSLTRLEYQSGTKLKIPDQFLLAFTSKEHRLPLPKLTTMHLVVSVSQTGIIGNMLAS
ncbi:hypothetical protein C8J56DRAFT_754913, partial [Mycena floridula]